MRKAQHQFRAPQTQVAYVSDTEQMRQDKKLSPRKLSREELQPQSFTVKRVSKQKPLKSLKMKKKGKTPRVKKVKEESLLESAEEIEMPPVHKDAMNSPPEVRELTGKSDQQSRINIEADSRRGPNTARFTQEELPYLA